MALRRAAPRRAAALRETRAQKTSWKPKVQSLSIFGTNIKSDRGMAPAMWCVIHSPGTVNLSTVPDGSNNPKLDDSVII